MEIVCALLLAMAVVLAPVLALWLLDVAGGPDWSEHRGSIFTVSMFVGPGLMVLWLLRARRFGL